MRELLKYLNSLEREGQEEYAARCKTTVGYLRKACSTSQVIREIVCSRLESESGGVVTRQSLRPNDWQVIWPELGQGQRPSPVTSPSIPHAIKDLAAAPLTTDAALEADLEKAEQAGLVHLPKRPAPWSGAERRVAQSPRRDIDRERTDIGAAGQGVS